MVKLSTLLAMTLSHQGEVEMHSVTRFKVASNMKYIYEIILQKYSQEEHFGLEYFVLGTT